MSAMNKICFFCKNSGEPAEKYNGHTKHTCEKLANIKCLKCGGQGHTERYCTGSGMKYTQHQVREPHSTGEWQEVAHQKKKLVYTISPKPERKMEQPAILKVNDDTTFPSLGSTPVQPQHCELNYAEKVGRTRPPPPNRIAPVAPVKEQEQDECMHQIVRRLYLEELQKDKGIKTLQETVMNAATPEEAMEEAMNIMKMLEEERNDLKTKLETKEREYIELLEKYNKQTGNETQCNSAETIEKINNYLDELSESKPKEPPAPVKKSWADEDY